MITAFTKSNREIVYNRVLPQIKNHVCAFCGTHIDLNKFGGTFVYHNNVRIVHNAIGCMNQLKAYLLIEKHMKGAPHGKSTKHSDSVRHIPVRVS